MSEVEWIRRHTNEWMALAFQVLSDHVRGVGACVHCGGPYILGYGCNRCGSADPSVLDPDPPLDIVEADNEDGWAVAGREEEE